MKCTNGVTGMKSKENMTLLCFATSLMSGMYLDIAVSVENYQEG
jgi:hypothetical protein